MQVNGMPCEITSTKYLVMKPLTARVKIAGICAVMHIKPIENILGRMAVNLKMNL